MKLSATHRFCNTRIREIKTKTAVAHNNFKFDFFSTERIEGWCLENKRHFYRWKELISLK